ncbi:MAG: imelysin family protein [Gammaproteobacteria bacterium]|nr:imelysin family protein [Gammaproteobacteria bacterium]
MDRRKFFSCLGSIALLPLTPIRADAGSVIRPAQWLHALADDLLVPGYRDLADEAQQLDRSLQALCAATDNNASQAQVQWRALAKTWRRLDVLPIGPTLERRSLRRFDFWPTRPAEIDAAIAGNATAGVGAQGLPALEYLLFDPARPLSAADGPRCRYAGQLAHAVADEAGVLAQEWRQWSAHWSDGSIDREREQAALTDAINAIIGALGQLYSRKLSKPMQALGRREPLFDAWRSGATRAHWLATADGLRIALIGGASGVGLTRLLRKSLAVRVTRDMRAVEHALSALPVQPAPKHVPLLKQAIAAVAQLQQTLAGDVAETLHISIGFNESDGD